MVVFMESGDAAEVDHAARVLRREARPVNLYAAHQNSVYVLLRMASTMEQEKARGQRSATSSWKRLFSRRALR